MKYQILQNVQGLNKTGRKYKTLYKKDLIYIYNDVCVSIKLGKLKSTGVFT